MGQQEEVVRDAKSVQGRHNLSLAERKLRAWGIDTQRSFHRKVGVKAGSFRPLTMGHPFAGVTRFDRWCMLRLLNLVGQPPVRVALWNGKVLNPGIANPLGQIQFQDRIAVLKLLLDPELHFGDMYSSGRIVFEGDMVAFLESVYLGIRASGKGNSIRRLIEWWGCRRRANSFSAARDHVYHHYDIGNDFYKHWLDTEVMQYTCAYFPRPDMSLEEAQLAKLHHVCRKLRLKPGEHVVEAGCGWGGLARFMARQYGVHVTAYNISHEQVAYAREQAAGEGLSGLVSYVEDDYRNIKGKYDVFVSVGMLEHVGKREYRHLGDVIAACLKTNGRGLIHTIGRSRVGPMNAWIERRIFPGAYPPTLREMMDIFEPNDFAIQDVENLRLHYARTIEHWLERFEQHAGDISELLDEEFVRAWRLYLAGSIAAFTSSELQLFQVLFTCAENNQLPDSRADIYAHECHCQAP